MKKQIILLVLCMAGILSSCNQESLLGDYTYPGPVPAIVDGPEQTAKLCYELYKKYDLHVYADLSGEPALTTPLGTVSENIFIAANPDSYPVQAPDKTKAAQFLTLLKSIFSLFPDDHMKTILFKRIVLTKIAPSAGLHSVNGEAYYVNYIYDAGTGIIFYGDLEENSTVTTEQYKQAILNATMYGFIDKSYKGITPPAAFSNVSKGYYRGEDGNYSLCFESNGKYKVETGYEYGFIAPEGAQCNGAEWSNWDMSSYAAWIISTPLQEREDVYALYPRVFKKTGIVLEFYKSKFGLNLEAMGAAYAKIK